MNQSAEFLEFALDRDVLRFGDYTLKSGRQSPYFFNAGQFHTGAALSRLGEFYATAIRQAGLEFDVLFGPAYKGIPLVAATSSAFWNRYRQDVPYAFNRKEAKDHGEGGVIVGAPLKGRVVIVDDVITAGTATREAVRIIRDAGARPEAVVICLDRQERGQREQSAVQEVERGLGLTVVSIATLTDLLRFLHGRPELAGFIPALRAYRERYGVGV